MNSALQQVFDQFSQAREAVRDAEKTLVGRIGCKVVTLREEIDGLNQELTELGRLQESLGDSRNELNNLLTKLEECKDRIKAKALERDRK